MLINEFVISPGIILDPADTIHVPFVHLIQGSRPAGEDPVTEIQGNFPLLLPKVRKASAVDASSLPCSDDFD